MRIASYRVDNREEYGVVVDDGVISLDRRLKGLPTLFDLIHENAFEDAKAAVEGEEPDHALADVTFLPPVTTPGKIFCIGVNYANRNEEYKDNSDAPKYPSVFIRFMDSIVGHEEDVIRPTVSEQLDYEGEIVLVIGKTGRHIPRETALDHVCGYTLCNEGTIRDWLRHAKFNVTQGKNFDKTGSMGPWLVTADDVDVSKPLHLQTRVNGEVRQDDTTANMIFPFDFLVSYLSTFATLRPGDVIISGTPTGAGARFDPPKWLKPGDVVEVEVPGIGLLRNTVADEA
jgi:2-keto-4-pentenoate hydratase/2-oxohepta-3-ene-1,7-dioic acid hydratase in catechol pathway